MLKHITTGLLSFTWNVAGMLGEEFNCFSDDLKNNGVLKKNF